jgi:hypothetical protein
LAALFASGRIVDLILVFTLLEVAAVWLYRRATGRGIAPVALAINLLSGIALLVALRLALTGAWWGWIGLFLFLSLLAHLADLARRWRDRVHAG